jgi:hypothetical protein
MRGEKMKGEDEEREERREKKGGEIDRGKKKQARHTHSIL